MMKEKKKKHETLKMVKKGQKSIISGPIRAVGELESIECVHI